MTQPPQRFSAYGAVDLSALKAPASSAAGPAAGSPGTGAVVVDVTEATFQEEVIDRSATVPVVIDFWADWCQPCKQLSPILERLAEQDGGRWVLAKIDIDANQRLAGAIGVQSIPMILAVVAGQPMPLFNGALPEAQVRRYLDELLRVAAANGVTGRVTPPLDDEAEEPSVLPPDPHAEAADLLAAGDLDGAETRYGQILADAPADPDAQQGLALVALVRRVQELDPSTVRQADARVDDVELQCSAADLELATGDPEAAFRRLVEAVRTSSGDERDRARTHLVTLFLIVGSADPRVIAARSALASALF